MGLILILGSKGQGEELRRFSCSSGRERQGYSFEPPNSDLQGEIQLDRTLLQTESFQVTLKDALI